MRKDFCLTSEDTTDNFVGIRFASGKPEVVFPRGYNIPDDESERRRDIFRLLYVLQYFSRGMAEGSALKNTAEIISTLPIQSYQYIIQDYLAHGYYTEKETVFKRDTAGKISWKRTIQTEKVQISGNNPVYLNFQVKQNRVNDKGLITQIHRYCVFESFRMFGWLYLPFDFLPPKPDIKLNRQLFLSVLTDALKNTNNDAKKKLFTSMINMINEKHEDFNYRTNALGVTHFAGIWERLIDHVFGEENKERYFPHAKWQIFRNGSFHESSALEPDTIMKNDGKIYILDAKYYQYGITERPDDLPNTSSIQKQITYARHVQNMGEVPPEKIYNAFVLPYNGEADNEGDYILKFVAVGTANWEEYNHEEMYDYKYILGILLDTRHLMTTFVRHNAREIDQLSAKIEESIALYKAQYAAQNS